MVKITQCTALPLLVGIHFPPTDFFLLPHLLGSIDTKKVNLLVLLALIRFETFTISTTNTFSWKKILIGIICLMPGLQKLLQRLQDISTPEFSTPSFNPRQFNPKTKMKFSTHDFSTPTLLNHELFNHTFLI